MNTLTANTSASAIKYKKSASTSSCRFEKLKPIRDRVLTSLIVWIQSIERETVKLDLSGIEESFDSLVVYFKP